MAGSLSSRRDALHAEHCSESRDRWKVLASFV